MADTPPLIVDSFDSSMLKGMPRARPDAVFVLSYADGKLRTFQRAPGFADRTGSRKCFIVDRSQRFSNGELRIPAHGGVYFFSTWFDAAWQVTDPEAIVRANLEFGEPVVSGFLKGVLWPLGRRFDPDDVQRAEETIVRSLQTPLTVGSGLTLNGLSLRLAADPRQVDGEVAVDEEAQRQRLVQSRVDQLRRLVGNDNPHLVLHLAEHPDDTVTALQLLSQTREQDANYKLALLDRMFTHGILTDADGDVLRQMVVGGTPALPPGTAGPPQGAAPALSPSPPPPPTLGPGGGGGSWGAPKLGSGPAAPAAPALAPPAPAAVVPPPAPPNVPQARPTQAPERPGDRGGVKGWRKFRRPPVT